MPKFPNERMPSPWESNECFFLPIGVSGPASTGPNAPEIILLRHGEPRQEWRGRVSRVSRVGRVGRVAGCCSSAWLCDRLCAKHPTLANE